MSLPFFLSFLFAIVMAFIVYNTVKFTGRSEYAKALYCLVANFFLCGIGVFLIFKFINHIAQCFFGVVFGFSIAVVGGFIFKQFSPYSVKELCQIVKHIAIFIYGKLKIYVPIALKFLKEKSKEIYLWIKNMIENRKR